MSRGRPATRLVPHGHRGRPAGAAAMTTGYVPGLGDALRHGPWVAGLCAFGVTPGPDRHRPAARAALAPPARAVRRRDLRRPAAGRRARRGRLADRPAGAARADRPAAGVAALVLCWSSGWRSGVTSCKRGYYTRAQAAAPTKIWHQLVVYPVMGYWLWTACIDGLSRAGGTAVWRRQEGAAGGAGRELGGDQRVRPPPSQAGPPAVRLAPGPTPCAALAGRVADRWRRRAVLDRARAGSAVRAVLRSFVSVRGRAAWQAADARGA